MQKVQTPYDDLTFKIIGLAMKIHRDLGPGFPEEIYKRAMIVAMNFEGVAFNRELKINIEYQGETVGDFKLDFVIEDKVIVEFKAVESLHPVHVRQLISYLAASGLQVGLLINMGTVSLQYKRIFPPTAVQSSAAFQSRKSKFNQSVQSAREASVDGL